MKDQILETGRTATEILGYTGSDITRHVGEMLALVPEWGVRDKFTQQDSSK